MMSNNQKTIDWIGGSLLNSFGNDVDPSDEALSIVVERAKNSSSATSPTKDKEFDSTLARAINSLSIAEREQTYEEIHGVADIIVETDAFVDEKLYELRKSLDDLDPKPQAYTMAIDANADYVHSRKFCLMFLRAERFNTSKAVDRILLFLEKKLQFFGAKSLGRNLRIDDLSEGDRRTLAAGSMQIVPFRDRSGRVIFLDSMFSGDRLFPNIMCHTRVQYFLIITTFENDEEAQRHGSVVIFWYMDYLRVDMEVDHRWTKEASLSTKWLPMRINAIHMCITKAPIKRFWAQFIIAVTPPALRTSFRVHEGTPTEVFFQLLSFGIPVDSLPVNDAGKLKNSNSKSWLFLFKARDAFVLSGSPFEKIAIPTKYDVLFGKGDTTRKHIGNQYFRQIIEQTNDAYFSLKSRPEKMQHTRKIVQGIEETSGRFLRKGEDGWWEIVDPNEARVKVMKAYSSSRKAKNKQTKHGAFEPSSSRAPDSQATKRLRLLPQGTPASILSVPAPQQEEGRCLSNLMDCNLRGTHDNM